MVSNASISWTEVGHWTSNTYNKQNSSVAALFKCRTWVMVAKCDSLILCNTFDAMLLLYCTGFVGSIEAVVVVGAKEDVGETGAGTGAAMLVAVVGFVSSVSSTSGVIGFDWVGGTLSLPCSRFL